MDQRIWSKFWTWLQKFSTPHIHCQRSLNRLPKVWELIITAQFFDPWVSKFKISLYISPSSGLFFISPDEDLLFEVETSRVNFLVSFNSDDQRNTDVATTADVTTYNWWCHHCNWWCNTYNLHRFGGKIFHFKFIAWNYTWKYWCNNYYTATKKYAAGQSFFVPKYYFIKNRFLATILQNDRPRRSLFWL